MDEATLYISLKFSTAIHLCPCGCGRQVVTPLSPIDWSLSFNGETISLYPSIGNWSFPCKSHYWIRNDEIIWSGKYSLREIDELHKKEKTSRERYFRRRIKEKTPKKTKKI